MFVVNHTNPMHWSTQDSAGAQKLHSLLLSPRLVVPLQQQATETATVKLTEEPSSPSFQRSL